MTSIAAEGSGTTVIVPPLSVKLVIPAFVRSVALYVPGVRVTLSAVKPANEMLFDRL